MNNQDFDCFIVALEITLIVVELLAYSQPLGFLTGIAILTYLYLITKKNERNQDGK